MNRPCLVCGDLVDSRPRCPVCEQVRQRTRNQARTQYHGPWQALSDLARKIQPWCTRCGTTRNLTLDHETGTVECRPCNSAHRKNADGAKK